MFEKNFIPMAEKNICENANFPKYEMKTNFKIRIQQMLLDLI